MAPGHLKINMVNEFVGTPCSSSTTVKDLIETLLDRKEVPIIFSRVCGIFALNKKTSSQCLLPQGDVAQNHASMDLNFRVINLPSDEYLKELSAKFPEQSANFTDLLINQVHKLYITGVWPTTQQTSINIAACKCGVEFGPYNRLKHPDGFILKQIKQFVPEARIKRIKDLKSFEEKILARWYDYTDERSCDTRQAAILHYLHIAAQSITLYGCTVIPITINKINGKKLGYDALLGCSGSSVILTLDDGEVVMDDEHANVQFEFGGKDAFNIKAGGKVLECNGTAVERFKEIVDFVKESKMPTIEDVVEEVGERHPTEEESDKSESSGGEVINNTDGAAGGDAEEAEEADEQ